MRSVSFRIKPKRIFLKKGAKEKLFADIRITQPKKAEGTYEALPFKWAFECEFEL